jgi:hypothetical protein
MGVEPRTEERYARNFRFRYFYLGKWIWDIRSDRFRQFWMITWKHLLMDAFNYGWRWIHYSYKNQTGSEGRITVVQRNREVMFTNISNDKNNQNGTQCSSNNSSNP